jgi:hypothetical protein
MLAPTSYCDSGDRLPVAIDNYPVSLVFGGHTRLDQFLEAAQYAGPCSMSSPAWANQARALFKTYGVTGNDIHVVVPLDADEAIFVISPSAAAGMRELELTLALSRLLKRKVWVATDGPQWRDRTEPLDRT